MSMNRADAMKLYRAASDKAEQHLLQLLVHRNHRVETIHSNLVVKKSEDGLEVETVVHVWPHYERFNNIPNGIAIRINRQSRGTNFNQKTVDYTKFNWGKIVLSIEEDLTSRLNMAKRRREEIKHTEEASARAQREVPLPIIHKQFEGTMPYLAGFERTLLPDGTYEISMTGSGFSREEALAVRDIVLAKAQRTNSK